MARVKSNRAIFFLIALCLTTASALFWPAVLAAPASKNVASTAPVDARALENRAFSFVSPNHPQRVINFPTAFSLGTVMIGKTIAHGQEGGVQARGRVVVPAGMLTKFEPSKDFMRDPSIIKTLPPDAFDSVKISAMSLDDSEDGWCDRALSSLGRMKGLIDLDMERSDATDKGAAVVGALPNLQRLNCFEAAISGSFFKQLSGHKKLRCLNISANPIKAEYYKYLAAVPQLQFLRAAGCDLSDEGVREICNCKSLIELTLSDNPGITGKSLSCLPALKNLRSLTLAKTSINPKDVLKLKSMQALVSLGLPQRPLVKADYDEIVRTFPKTTVSMPGDKRKSLDADNKVLLAPLH